MSQAKPTATHTALSAINSFLVRPPGNRFEYRDDDSDDDDEDDGDNMCRVCMLKCVDACTLCKQRQGKHSEYAKVNMTESTLRSPGQVS